MSRPWGRGTDKTVQLFTEEELATNLNFLNYTAVEPGVSIGEHQHGAEEEVYIILEGTGLMQVNGKQKQVRAGDVIISPPYCRHSLLNNSEEELRILVFEISK